MTFPELVNSFIAQPGPDTLRRLRAVIMSSPTYDPLTRIGASTHLAEGAGDHARVIEEIRGTMPGSFLSPGAHGRLATAHAALGDSPAALREAHLLRLSEESIVGRSTGDPRDPLSVLRVEDEYDILELRGRRSTEQREEAIENGVADVHLLDDGTELWFRLLWRDDEVTATP